MQMPKQNQPQPESKTSLADLFWQQAKAALSGLPDGGLNIAHEAVDRHAIGSHRHQVAIRCIDSTDTPRDFTYLDLCKLTNQFANVLQQLQVVTGDCVSTLLGRVPELYITALGTLKSGCVFCPLFSVFGPEPIRTRLFSGNAKVLVTSRRLYENKIEPLRKSLPGLKHILIVDQDSPPAGDNFWQLLNRASDHFTISPTKPQTPALLHFTSGTTGKPKGALHVHNAVVAHYASARYALDLRPGDIFWCTADPGWVTGTSYGIIAPLVIGATLLVDEQEFDPVRWCQLLQSYQVNVWYTTPTAIRMMMRLGIDLIRFYDFSSLRFAASVGEPLNAELVLWGKEAFGIPLHDSWWQTETGAIMIANHSKIEIKPGSMGKPLPGVESAVINRISEHELEIIDVPDQVGELALRVGWPSMFVGYLNDEDRYRLCFINDWYLSGDIVRRDVDGYFWFVGRVDDAIKSSGHLIGPYEVERVLLAHPAVADAGVIGLPDPVINETVKAYVVLKAGYIASDDLKHELRAQARKALGPSVAPREIEFCAKLPKTRSGKVMRRLLKTRALGLPEGDLSTLDSNL
jgi:acetyl-CoA synthetase